MSLLIYREVLRPAWSPQYRAQPVTQPRDYWLGVFSGGQRVGFVNARLTPREKEGRRGTQFRALAELNLPLFGRLADLSIRGEGFRENLSGKSEFDLTLRSAGQDFRVDGTFDQGKIAANVHAGDTVTPFNYDAGEQMLFSGGMSGLDLPPLRPGEEIYMDAFNPISMRMEKARISCAAQETLHILGKDVLTNVLETELGPITTKAWIDQDQEVVRVETPFGFTLEKIDPTDAYAPTDPDQQADLIQNLAVTVTGPLPAREATLLRFRMTGVDESALPPADTWQTREGDLYTVRMPVAPAGEVPAPSPAEIGDALDSDPLVNAAHKDIQRTAAEITQGAGTPWEKALRIYAWVYENLEKTSVLSIPTALEVLSTRKGDCNEHTVLFAALARAAGVPARIAIGLVYSDELGGFGYHAWPEVLAGQWIPMDPTLGQPLADATHIKLLNGGIDQWPRLVAYIGQAKIEILGADQ